MAAAAGVGAYGSAFRRGGPLLSGVASVRALSRSGAVSSRGGRGPPSAGKRFRSVAIIDVGSYGTAPGGRSIVPGFTYGETITAGTRTPYRSNLKTWSGRGGSGCVADGGGT